MADFLSGLLVSTASGTLLAGLLFLLRPFVGGRAPQKIQYFSWYAVFVRMLLPFSIGGIFIGGLLTPAPGQAAANPAASGVSGTFSAAGAAVLQPAGTVPAAAASPAITGTIWPAILFSVWLLGVAAALLLCAAGYLGYMSQIRATRIAVSDPDTAALYRACAAECGLTRTPPVYVSAFADVPMLCGFFRCAVILPDRSFSPAQLRHTFLHELTHYRGHDNLLKSVAVLAVCAEWFNPAAYLAVREAGRLCELACDERVTSGLTREERIRYGETLLTASSTGSRRPFALSATMSDEKRNMKERLKLLAKGGQSGGSSSRRWAPLPLAVAAAAALTFTVSCAKPPAPAILAGKLTGVSSEADASQSPASGALSADSAVTPVSAPSAVSQNILPTFDIDVFYRYVNDHGFKILMNSGTGGVIRLPDSFTAEKDGYAIGDMLKNRNALSKQNGLDFSGYLGKTLSVYSCWGEKRKAGDSELAEVDGGPRSVCIVALYDGEKLVSFWSHASSDKPDDFGILSKYLGAAKPDK